MEVLHFSLDNLSMMALILSIGFVVDDAIVMLENIVRHMEARRGAARGRRSRGSKEIGFTIVSMTISLAAVFIPILFMGGILGRLFREFAVTITTAILISGVVSVTLTPMLCSRFLRVAALHAKTGLAGLMERLFNRLAARLRRRACALVLRHRPAMLALFVAVLAATVQMFGVVPKGFIPDTDNDSIRTSTCGRRRGPRTTRWSASTLAVADVVRRNPVHRELHGEHRRRRRRIDEHRAASTCS